MFTWRMVLPYAAVWHFLTFILYGTVSDVQLQECIVEHRDWRQCQNEVHQFRQCMVKYTASSAKDQTL